MTPDDDAARDAEAWRLVADNLPYAAHAIGRRHRPAVRLAVGLGRVDWRGDWGGAVWDAAHDAAPHLLRAMRSWLASDRRHRHTTYLEVGCKAWAKRTRDDAICFRRGGDRHAGAVGRPPGRLPAAGGWEAAADRSAEAADVADALAGLPADFRGACLAFAAGGGMSAVSLAAGRSRAWLSNGLRTRGDVKARFAGWVA